MIGTGRLQARLQLNYRMGIYKVVHTVGTLYGRPVNRPAEEVPARSRLIARARRLCDNHLFYCTLGMRLK